jgi:spore coat polysaccharide biosynthesis protein SpsF
VTALVLQARLDSSRLPGKSLLPLGGRPLVFRVMEALKGIAADLHVLACPDDCVEAFEPLAREAGFVLSTGPKEDVLARYCAAVRRFAVDRVIRATADNPFVFTDAAEAINAQAVSLNADYAGFAGLPVGAGVESVSAEALLRAEKEAALPHEREHVCPYLYGHGEIFSLHRPLAPQSWRGSSLRVTVDTMDDYRRAERMFEFLSRLKTDERHKGSAVIAAVRASETAGDR